MITTLNEFLADKQYIYHYTNLENFKLIIKSNSLKSNKNTGISTTRDKTFHERFDTELFGNIRITLNYNKLKNNYKIQPFQDQTIIVDDEDWEPIDNTWKGFPSRSNVTNEFEERILTNEIKNISNYIISLTTDKYNYEKMILDKQIMNYLNKNNIELSLYNSNVYRYNNVY